jgi:hypothetical protein
MRFLKFLGFTCIGILALISLLWWLLRPNQPSDQALEQRFYKQRPVLERLVAMMDEDWQMARIADDFTWRQDSVAWPRPELEWGISRKRWEDIGRYLLMRVSVTERTGARSQATSWSLCGVGASFLPVSVSAICTVGRLGMDTPIPNLPALKKVILALACTDIRLRIATGIRK